MSHWYEEAACPDCGAVNGYEADWVPVNAQMTKVGETELGSPIFEFTGESEPCWDGQTNASQLDEPKSIKTTLGCYDCGMSWQTRRFDIEEE